MKRKTFLAGFLAALSTLVVPLALAQQRPATRPAAPPEAPAPQPFTLADEDGGRVAELTRKSIALLRSNSVAEAEKVLHEAVELAPTHSTNLYNLACCKALLNKPQEALDWLEKSAEAGFTDFVHLARDPDLNSLRNLPRYKQLVARKGEFQRKAAERAVERMKAQFGEGYLYEIDPEHKLIFATNVDQPTLDALKSWLTAQARSQWRTLFAHRPDEFILVVVPSLEHYRKIIPMPGVGGIYMDGAKTLIAQRLGQVMTHEFTHALHAGDMAAEGQEHPIWLAEGLGSLFEAARFDENGELVPADNFRLTYLQRAARGDRLIPLEQLLKMDQKEFVDRANLAYGQASSLLLYLHEKGLLRKFYDTYKKTFTTDSAGRVALFQTTGMKVPELEKAWREWMLARTAPPLHTGPEGPVVGAQLGDANDGMLVQVLVEGGPADRAGIEQGDVIVGLDGREVRDYFSFAPMLSAYEPGDEVTLRVRRGEEYLDVPVTLERRSNLTAPRGRGRGRGR